MKTIEKKTEPSNVAASIMHKYPIQDENKIVSIKNKLLETKLCFMGTTEFVKQKCVLTLLCLFFGCKNIK